MAEAEAVAAIYGARAYAECSKHNADEVYAIFKFAVTLALPEEVIHDARKKVKFNVTC
jgi:hypothetical protein